MQTHTEVVSTPAIPISRPTGTATNESVTTAHGPYAGRRAISARLVQGIYLIFGVIVGLLLIRFSLRALAANAEAGFAQAIYGITGVFVAPFIGLFGSPQITTGAAFEVSTLLALLVYAGIGWVLARAAWLIFGESRTSSVASSSSKQTRVG